MARRRSALAGNPVRITRDARAGNPLHGHAYKSATCALRHRSPSSSPCVGAYWLAHDRRGGPQVHPRAASSSLASERHWQRGSQALLVWGGVQGNKVIGLQSSSPPARWIPNAMTIHVSKIQIDQYTYYSTKMVSRYHHVVIFLHTAHRANLRPIPSSYCLLLLLPSHTQIG